MGEMSLANWKDALVRGSLTNTVFVSGQHVLEAVVDPNPAGLPVTIDCYRRQPGGWLAFVSWFDTNADSFNRLVCVMQGYHGDANLIVGQVQEGVKAQ